MKRTNLVLDEQLLEEATRLSGERTYSRTVNGRSRISYVVSMLGGSSIWPVRDSGKAISPRCAKIALSTGHVVAVVLVDTVRSGVDCLIAACAIRHSLSVMHRDRDFDKLARISPLDSRIV